MSFSSADYFFCKFSFHSDAYVRLVRLAFPVGLNGEQKRGSWEDPRTVIFI
jgi:hypothetical protein